MAGRGRGGGRGRGRGGMSFNVEQFGFGGGEAIPGPVLQPPPLYPPLERRPVPLKSGTEVEYLLALKRDFVEHIKYSPAYVLPGDEVKDIERYSDCKSLDTPNKTNPLVYDWKRFPHELRPQTPVKKRKKKPAEPNGVSKRVKKVEDINIKLEELEKIEKEEEDDPEEKGEENKEEAEKEEGEGQEGEEEEEDQDEEMDDGTDYVNNYFDNGESYLDEEDDNLDDDGPVY